MSQVNFILYIVDDAILTLSPKLVLKHSLLSFSTIVVNEERDHYIIHIWEFLVIPETLGISFCFSQTLHQKTCSFL